MVISDSSMIIFNSNCDPENLHVVKYEGIIIDAICSQGFLFGESDMIYTRKDRKDAPLCECGYCNEKTKYNKQKKKYNRFVKGHQNRGKNNGMYGRTGEKCPAFGVKRYDIKGDKNPAKRPEVRKLISKNNARAMLNKTHSTKAKEGISKNHRDISGKNNPMYKMGYTILGDKNVSKRPEVRAKISKTLMGRFVGDKNPSWKGGISNNPYCYIWTNKEYKNDILKRDNYECQNPDCWKNCDHLPLERHHINGNKEDCHFKNIIILCKSCNGRARGNKEFSSKSWIELYQNIMTKKYGYEYDRI